MIVDWQLADVAAGPQGGTIVMFHDASGAASTLEQAKRRCSEVSGVSNSAYDVLAILTNKLHRIAAMEAYKLDAAEAEDQELAALLDTLVHRQCENVARLKDLADKRLVPS
jgi:hypothetical protein